MAKPKMLAEWFWSDRWTGSSGFLLPAEPRGVYREMLTQSWHRNARLPNDHEAIRRACGITESEWDRCWPVVKQFWRVKGEYLVNDTQMAIYREAVRRQRAQSERGAKGAAKRWSKHCPSNAQASAHGMASVSDHQSVQRTPLTPLEGGRVTRADRKQAKEIREKAWGGCRHEPRCTQFHACVELIAKDIADRRLEAAS